MTTILRNLSTWTLLATFASFWLWAPFVSEARVYDVLYLLGGSIAAGLLVSYGAGLYVTLTMPRQQTDAGHFLVMAVFATTYGFLGFFGYLWLGGRFDIWAASFLWMMVCGFAIKSVSIGAIDGKLPRENFVRLGLTVTAGLIFFTALFKLMSRS